MQKTVAQEALEILRDIPEDRWTFGAFQNNNDQRCAIGHYNYAKFKDANFDYNGGKLRNVSETFLRSRGQYGDIAGISNEATICYHQITHKARTIALLTDMVEAGY